MTDLTTVLKNRKRPSMLVGAARKGLALYRRDRDLRSILRKDAASQAVPEMLLAAEEQLEKTRKTGDAGYSIADHISVLTALIAEASLRPARG